MGTTRIAMTDFPGQRPQVVFRAASYSQPLMSSVGRDMLPIERGRRRVRVDHSLWAPRERR